MFKKIIAPVLAFAVMTQPIALHAQTVNVVGGAPQIDISKEHAAESFSAFMQWVQTQPADQQAQALQMLDINQRLALFDLVKQRVDVIRTSIESKDQTIAQASLINGLSGGTGVTATVAVIGLMMGKGMRYYGPKFLIAGISTMLVIISGTVAAGVGSGSTITLTNQQKNRLVDEINLLNTLLASSIESLQTVRQLTLQIEQNSNSNTTSINVN